jgi:hypothetical protein
MRIRVLVLMAVGVLILAGAATAQVTNGTAVNAPTPPTGSTPSQSSAVGGEAGSRHYRYLQKVEALKDKVARTKAQDGGQLTAEHEASLKGELDRLNRIYGVKPG